MTHSERTSALKPHLRQAVVVVHGMGEQRPLETLTEFMDAALEADRRGNRTFFSRPDQVVDSFESRRFLAPRAFNKAGELRAQTEFFEYHWAHLMQDNRIGDLWPTVRRMLLTPPWYVPIGLLVVWGMFWALVLAVLALVAFGPDFHFDLSNFGHLDLSRLGLDDVVRAIAGGGFGAFVLTYAITHWLPPWLTSSFVDVVRYLDTSPRSYEVRHDIRAGMINLLTRLHTDGRYQRIIIVAHSLGSYIAYDAISYLWDHTDMLRSDAPPVRARDDEQPGHPDGLAEVEAAASALTRQSDAAAFQAAQRRLWLGLRAQGNPWLITDFLSFGSPMYMADRILTRNRRQFMERVSRRELPTCPPQTEPGTGTDIHGTLLFSWTDRGVRVLDHAAPFAVVRWTNAWFPARFFFFGDWFGGPLRPLFGNGILDRRLEANGWRSRIPAYAHALYYHFERDEQTDSVTTHLRQSMGLAATPWLMATLPDPLLDPPSNQRVDGS
jgi:hypothetical protein